MEGIPQGKCLDFHVTASSVQNLLRIVTKLGDSPSPPQAVRPIPLERIWGTGAVEQESRGAGELIRVQMIDALPEETKRRMGILQEAAEANTSSCASARESHT